MTVKAIEDEMRADRISQIIELTKCSREEAITVLYDCDNDVERAISHIFDHGKVDDTWQTSKTNSKPKNKNPGLTNQKSEEKKSGLSVGNSKSLKNEKFRFQHQSHRDTGKPSGRGGKSFSNNNDRRNFDQRGGGANKPNHHTKEDNVYGSHSDQGNVNTMQPVVDEWDPNVEYGEWTGEDIEVFNSDANLVLESCATKEVEAVAKSTSREDKSYDALYNNIFRTKPFSKKPASGVNFKCSQPVIISPNALAKSSAGKASIPKFTFGDASLKLMISKLNLMTNVSEQVSQSQSANSSRAANDTLRPINNNATPVIVATTAAAAAAAPTSVKQFDMSKMKQQQQQQQQQQHQVNGGVQNVMSQLQKHLPAHLPPPVTAPASLPPGMQHLIHPYNATNNGSGNNSYQTSQFGAANSAGNSSTYYEYEKFIQQSQAMANVAGNEKSLAHSKQQQPPSAQPVTTSTQGNFAGPGFHPHHAPPPPPPHPSQQTFNPQLHQIVPATKMSYYPNAVIYMPSMYQTTGPPPPQHATAAQTAYLKSANNNNGNSVVAGGNNGGGGGGGPTDHHLDYIDFFDKMSYKKSHQQAQQQQQQQQQQQTAAGAYKNGPPFSMPDHHGGGGAYAPYASSELSPYYYSPIEAASQNPHLLHSLQQQQQQGGHRN